MHHDRPESRKSDLTRDNPTLVPIGDMYWNALPTLHEVHCTSTCRESRASQHPIGRMVCYRQGNIVQTDRTDKC